MEIFYCRYIQKGLVTLPVEESNHITKVMRKTIGNIISITDGKGTMYSAEIVETGKHCIVNASFVKTVGNNRDYRFHLAVAPTKMMERFEWIVEKCMEIGIDEITPVLCEHSERKIIKTDRLYSIAIAAMKQSGNIYLPVINEIISFDDFIDNEYSGVKCIAHCENLDYQYYYDIANNGDNLILIGPEGDFSRKEVCRAKERGFIPVSLGNSILRVETASIMACSMAAIKNYTHNID